MKNPELAKQMRALRTINGYTQQQIADILNIDRTTYTAYELSKNTPDVMLLDTFAKIFSVDIDFILNLDTRHPERLSDEADAYEQDHQGSLVSTLAKEERELLGVYRILNEKDKAKVRKLIDTCNPCKKEK